MNRKWLPLIAIVAVVATAAMLLILLLRSPSAPPSMDLPEENVVDPLRVEMDCIDRVLANGSLKSEDVDLALARCRGAGASGTAPANSQ